MTSESNGVPIASLWNILWRGKWLIAAVTTLCVMGAVWYALTTTPLYRAQALLTANEDQFGDVVRQGGGMVDIASLVGLSGSRGSERDVWLAILNSRSFTEQFVTELNLLPELFYEKWDADRKQWLIEEGKSAPSLYDAYKKFNEDLRKIQIDDDGLITLSIEWHDRAAAALWANEMVDQVNVRIKTRAINQAQQTVDYLQAELKKTSNTELKNGMYRLIEEQISTIALANVRTQYAFRVIDPAVVLPEDEKFHPKSLFLVVVGAAFGVAVSVFMLLFASFVREP